MRPRRTAEKRCKSRVGTKRFASPLRAYDLSERQTEEWPLPSADTLVVYPKGPVRPHLLLQCRSRQYLGLCSCLRKDTLRTFSSAPVANSMLKKLLLRFFLVTGPILWLVAYLIYKGKDYLHVSRGVVVHPLVYELIMVVALSLMLSLTAGDILWQIRESSRKSDQGSK
jgi:hypothetical protein